jgi:hypothetical protein
MKLLYPQYVLDVHQELDVGAMPFALRLHPNLHAGGKISLAFNGRYVRFSPHHAELYHGVLPPGLVVLYFPRLNPWLSPVIPAKAGIQPPSLP